MATPDLLFQLERRREQAIVSFVNQITSAGDGYVAPSERIAAFDNDGTLWCEKPMYAQADFVFRKWGEMYFAKRPRIVDLSR